MMSYSLPYSNVWLLFALVTFLFLNNSGRQLQCTDDTYYCEMYHVKRDLGYLHR